MQLVNEDDGVLILHQFLHDGLQPLFELAAILGAGDDQRKIQRQNALIGQEAGHVAVGDALGQAFDDGGLADARLADQHRIVLGAAAQDLHHALQFVIAPDQGIEQAVHRGLGQVAAELTEKRAFFRPIGRHFFRARPSDLLTNLREAKAALVQNIGGEALLLTQQSEQKMLGSDVLVVQPLGFLGAIGEHALAFVAQRQVDGGGYFLAQRGMRFDLLANRFNGRAGSQEAVGQRLIFPQQPQQQVFGFDARTAELAGFIAGEKDHPAGLFGIAFKHNSCPDYRLRPYRLLPWRLKR